MNVNWVKVASVGLRIVSAVIGSAGSIEQIAKSIPGLKGKDKEDAAVAMAKEALSAAEQVAGHDLLNDPEVESAVRAFLETYVALQNVLAAKQPAAQPGT